MIRSGVASVTFRELSPEQIVRLAQDAGLDGIEWGGDVHVVHGDIARATEVREATEDAGLCVASYGSYYRVGCEQRYEKPPTFDEVLETAVALRAPTIRVWAGNRASADASDAWWKTVLDETRRVADLAAAAGVRVAFEFHGGTLTDTTESACRLLERVNHDNVGGYWQIQLDRSQAERYASLEQVMPWLANLHVFYWEEFVRKPLAAGADEWRRYFERAARDGEDRFALLEFVEDDDPKNLARDAETLNALLAVD